MPGSVNVVAIVGNLTKDPELRNIPSGTAVTTLRVAVNDRVKRNDEWTDVPYYFDVVVWAGQAEACCQYLQRGSKVGVQGKLAWREWEATDGSGKRQAVEIVADTVQFLTPRGESQSAGQQPFEPGVQRSGATSEPDFVPASAPAAGDDDIPF